MSEIGGTDLGRSATALGKLGHPDFFLGHAFPPYLVHTIDTQIEAEVKCYRCFLFLVSWGGA